MSRLLTFVAVVVVCGVAAAGCAKGQCEDLCVWVDDCVIDVDNEECVEECVEQHDDSNSCGDAVKNLVDCIGDRGCGTVVDNCQGEIFDYENECG
jgi:hypothetical protein